MSVLTDKSTTKETFFEQYVTKNPRLKTTEFEIDKPDTPLFIKKIHMNIFF